jgi:hypothetical protein
MRNANGSSNWGEPKFAIVGRVTETAGSFMTPALLRRSIAFGPPLVLAPIEIGHPAIWPGKAIFTVIHPIAS